jgi:putative spermidine/putrescine transport system permease protein
MQYQLKRPHRAKPVEPPYADSIVGYDTWIGVAVADAMMIAPFAVILITSHCHKLIDELIWLSTGLGQFATAGVHHYSSQYPLRNYHSRLPSFCHGGRLAPTLLITSINAVTPPRMMWMGLRDKYRSRIAKISVILIGIVMVAVVLKATISSNFGQKAADR